jgi:hypothetical protein
MKPIRDNEMKGVDRLECDGEVQTEDSLSVIHTGVLLWSTRDSKVLRVVNNIDQYV